MESWRWWIWRTKGWGTNGRTTGLMGAECIVLTVVGTGQGCVRGRLRRGHRAGQGVGRMRRYGPLVGQFEYQGVGAEVCVVLLYFTLLDETLLGSYTPLYVLLRVYLFVCFGGLSLFRRQESFLFSFLFDLLFFYLEDHLLSACHECRGRTERPTCSVQFRHGIEEAQEQRNYVICRNIRKTLSLLAPFTPFFSSTHHFISFHQIGSLSFPLSPPQFKISRKTISFLIQAILFFSSPPLHPFSFLSYPFCKHKESRN